MLVNADDIIHGSVINSQGVITPKQKQDNSQSFGGNANNANAKQNSLNNFDYYEAKKPSQNTQNADFNTKNQNTQNTNFNTKSQNATKTTQTTQNTKQIQSPLSQNTTNTKLPTQSQKSNLNPNILNTTASKSAIDNKIDPAQQAQFNTLTKEQYLTKFYEVWDISKVNTNKNDIFYILPSLQNALTYNTELQELKKKPPKKNAKNYQKLLQNHNKKIADLEAKITRLLGVGENLLPNNLEEFSYIVENMNLSAFLKAPKTGIITQAGFVRAVPTHKPRYKSKDDFPFDRWQNSFIFEGTPVMITHFSRDGRFAHVQAPFVYGFIDVRNVALVDNSMRSKILKFEDYKVAKLDYVPLFYNNQWVQDARIGQIIPYNRRSNRLITFYKGEDNFAQIREIDFDSYQFADFPMQFSADKMSHLINMMIGQKYGWGGIFGNRDCSSFTRDSFGSFGVFLPRNSAAQAKYKGAFVDLSKMSDSEKESYIIANGVPFGSIIWLKGHIMLYIGYTNISGANRAIVAHSAWGVNPVINNKKEKIQLGGVKITTLHIGGDFTSNTPIKNSIISRVQGITNIYADSITRIDLSNVRVEY
ncbi:hypothetical protein DCO58_10695 [Helicobacter saguini]|uniref:NlpC/P60 domain-containing protein n=2 Tax=Helicobacter saguini TaxID=1548018 RepID=A0A347W0U4_9HELI|nr:hypothetical protein [Helicobacter saguini]MWV68100.1 hypothetical protein [Helicobacter saguini]MWV70436.1 hypothetical protein [Helicobacter saguini]MWV72337.1 hypothetical protein [Helicobacter saguini]TLD93020.1 hypothetical protein LS64_009340 [Helicobacter saguini]